ncbi:MAG TPA: CHASE2 domain-containing protein [Coleofasciculaceae cyanobacterium]
MLHLRVQKIDGVCLFELTWGQGQRLSQRLAFSEELFALYERWQRAYLNFYQTAEMSLGAAESTMRGKGAGSGSFADPADPQRRLVEAETRLLYDFHRWLRQVELYDIRTKISEFSQTTNPAQTSVDLFLTCEPIELARLPWEAWEIGAATGSKIQITRIPANIRTRTAAVKPRRRPRILAIMGDETGLSFTEDYRAVQSLSRLAEVKFVGWQKQPIEKLKTQIVEAIADPQGWDVLFFAGHSNETQLTGGELGIAPNTSIRVSEIAPKLAIAKERGLQFALFNSCNGMSLAESLIDLGLSQVAVMREPIPNRVAQAFLVRFVQGLADHQDVQESLLHTCQWLKTEQNLTYPSAHLVPSLFCQPPVTWFRIPLQGVRQRLRRWLPQRREAILLGGFALLSLLLPVQQALLEQRVAVQALYRQATLRADSAMPPPLLLVQIDEQSLEKEARLRPIPRTYLAKLVNRLSRAKVIGIDYLLYPPIPTEDPVLQDAMRQAAKRGTRFVMGASRDRNTRAWRQAPSIFAETDWSRSGSMTVRGWQYVELFTPESSIPPLAYVLAELHRRCTGSQSVNCTVSAPPSNVEQLFRLPSRLSPQPITSFSYQLAQMWLHPIVDYSIPPSQVFQSISAKDLLDQPLLSLPDTVLIAPNYKSAGVDREGEDNTSVPAAIQHWLGDQRLTWTGGEYHAYLFQHFLAQRLVVPIPDFWLVVLAGFLGKGVILFWRYRRLRQRSHLLILTAVTSIYILLSWELYLSPIAILLPIVLPILTFWSLILLTFAPHRGSYD